MNNKNIKIQQKIEFIIKLKFYYKKLSFKMVKETIKQLNEISRDNTVNVHKSLHKKNFKKKALKSLKELISFAWKNMFTEVKYKVNKIPLNIKLLKGRESWY